METGIFKKVDKEVFELLREFFYALKGKAVGYAPARNLHKILDNLENSPLSPKNNIVVSIDYEDTSLTIVYTDYKIELSDYVSEKFDSGTDHYQRFCFRYEAGGYNEQTGNIYEFRSLLFSALQEVNVENISISEEE